MEQLAKQRITSFELWDGIFDRDRKAKENISKAHKQIVEYAKVAGWKEVCIGEDDLKFFAEGAWYFFLKNKPDDYDIYLASVYIGQLDEKNEVKDFCGLTLYIVHERFYDKFLSADPYDHLDRALSTMNGKYVVCNPFVAEQYSGFSSNTGKDEIYDNLMNGRNKFKGI